MKFESIEEARKVLKTTPHNSKENNQAFEFLFDNDPEFIKQEKEMARQLLSSLQIFYNDDGMPCYRIRDVAEAMGVSVEDIRKSSEKFGGTACFIEDGNEDKFNTVQ